MEYIIFVLMKALYLNFASNITFYKINDLKITVKDTFKIVSASIFVAGIYTMLREYHTLNIIITFAIQSILLKLLSKENGIICKNIIANAIVYIGFTIGSLLDFPIISILDNKLINLIISAIIATILLIGFFKVKRFKRGFAFLKNKLNNDYTEIAMINISAFVILAYSLFGNYYGDVTKQILFTFIAVGIIMIIMIQKTLTLYYKQKLLQQNIESYKEEIKEKDEKIKELSDEKFKISKLNHEFYNRQRALELKV